MSWARHAACSTFKTGKEDVLASLPQVCVHLDLYSNQHIHGEKISQNLKIEVKESIQISCLCVFFMQARLKFGGQMSSL